MNARDPFAHEQLIGRVLLAGTTASMVCLAVGLIAALAGPDGKGRDLSNLLLRAGLIILMATPVTRVVVSLVEYAAGRDWLFAGLAAAVLALLGGSLAVAVVR